MVAWLALAAVLAAPHPETALGRGFADVAFAGDVAIIASGDGTVRSLHGAAIDIAFRTGRKMVGVAVSEDGRRVAVVGAGVVARSDDGGHIFRVEPLPDEAMAYAAAFVGDSLLVFDREGRGFRTNRAGRFEPLTLPTKTRWWTASFDGSTGWVVGEGGALIGTRDGGQTWFKADSPDPAPQGVLTLGPAVYVSGEKGVWRSTNGGASFRNVLTLPGERTDCLRMARGGKRIAVACAPLGHTLYKSDDGERFDAIAAPDAANMLAVAISNRGELVAVGAYELVLRTKGRAGTLFYHSEESRKWQQVLRSLEAEKAAKARALGLKGGAPRAPSKDARVVMGTLEYDGGEPAAVVEVRLSSPLDAQTVKTDRFGRFRFKAARADQVRVIATAPGFAPVSEDVFVRPLDATALTLVFRKAVPLAGTIIGPSGVPVAALVRLLPAPPLDADRTRYIERAVPVSVAESSPQGRFAFSAVPPDEYLLDVRAQGLKPHPMRVIAPNEELTVKLSAGARITGRFLDANGPLPGSTIALRQLPRGTESAATVAPSGEFVITGLGDGRYSIEATARERRVCIRREVEIEGGAPVDVVLKLGRGHNISGRVVDEVGAPVPGARVMGTTTADPLCGARVADADERGEFVLEDVAESTYSVSAVVIGAKMRSGRAFAETDARAGQRITVRVTR